MSEDWDALTRKGKKKAAQKTLEKLGRNKKNAKNPLLHLFHLKKVRTLWVYLKRPFAVAVIIFILYRMI